MFPTICKNQLDLGVSKLAASNLVLLTCIFFEEKCKVRMEKRIKTYILDKMYGLDFFHKISYEVLI